MRDKILFVDDDPDILTTFKRNFRRQYEVETALSGEEGLQLIARQGPFPVVVSDMRMPGMNGTRFLTRVREISPDSVRILLTGQAEISDAIEVVNEGSIFRFLTKPCPPETLLRVLQEALKHYQLVLAERELLDKTLSGSIRALTEILAMVNPESSHQTQQIIKTMRIIIATLNIPDAWELELAAMLARIGEVTVPPMVLLKARGNHHLKHSEKKIIDEIPLAGYRLLKNIPRLENVARIILYQNKLFDGTGFPVDSVKGKDIPLGSRLLKILVDLDQLEEKKMPLSRALEIMAARKGHYDPALLTAVRSALLAKTQVQPPKDPPSTRVKISMLKAGQLLLSNIETTEGTILVRAGNRLTNALLMRIHNWAQIAELREPVFVASEPELGRERHRAAHP